MPRGFRTDVGHFWNLVVRTSGTEFMSASQMVNGIKVAEVMMLNFPDGHPVFRATSALERGELKSKGVEKKSIHFNGSEETVELILRIVISANQLSIYGAVVDLCEEFDPDSRNQTERGICESLVIPTEIPNTDAISQSSTSLAQWDLLQEYERKFAELLDDQKLLKLCSDAGFSDEIEKGQLFITIEETERVDSFEYNNRSSLGCENLSSRRTLLY